MSSAFTHLLKELRNSTAYEAEPFRVLLTCLEDANPTATDGITSVDKVTNYLISVLGPDDSFVQKFKARFSSLNEQLTRHNQTH